MILSFTATEYEIDAGTGRIGFGNDEHYFIMQPEESKHGFSTNPSKMWLERDDQCWGNISGEYTWKIQVSHTHFIIETSLQHQMGCERIVVTISMPESDYNCLIALLKKLMSEHLHDLSIDS